MTERRRRRLAHLVSAAGGVDWRIVIVTTSVLSALGGLVVLGVRGQYLRL